MPKALQAAWIAQRQRWEADPEWRHADVAAALGVSRPTVTQRAKREGWSRAVKPSLPEQMAQVVVTLAETPLDVLVSADVLDLSVASRVATIQKHRADWESWRSLFPKEAMASDPHCAKRAKVAAEALAICQRGEAISYGLVTWSGTSTNAPIVDDEAAADSDGSTIVSRILARYAETGEFPQEAMTPPAPMQPNAGLLRLGDGMDES